MLSEERFTEEKNEKNNANTSKRVFDDPRLKYAKDTRTKTLPEIAHFITTIPFSDERPTNEVWLSPDFVLMLKKGNLHDHTLLMVIIDWIKNGYLRNIYKY